MRATWTEAEMIEETLDYWEDPAIEAEDCRVIVQEDAAGEPCKVVLHERTGRTSTEAGDGGRWHMDGSAYGD
jgi:hypothetical protein